ncbi:DNA-directed RNA polymerase I subunit rpa49 [Serendipita sp. 400]|nr:DNA-directed RNA polymerase I subunit rpa49 [Serendipita sp. 400]
MPPMATMSKKRKREDPEGGPRSDHIKFNLWNNNTAALGPTLILPSALGPTGVDEFSYFFGGGTSVPLDSNACIITGENNKMRYISSNSGTSNQDRDCQYLLCIRDKDTNQMHMCTSSIFPVHHYVKAFEPHGTELSQSTEETRRNARARLGEAFGTKKGQAAIRAAERSRVDISAMVGVSDILQATIGTNTRTLPPSDQTKGLGETRPHIPRFNPNATSPSDVYPLDGMVSDAEFSCISLGLVSLDKLPFRRSAWLNNRVKKKTSEQPIKSEKTSAKLLFYISSMLAFRRVAFKPMEQEDLRGRLVSVPEPIVDSLITRFTEGLRGSTIVHLTPPKEMELIAHLLALCLRVDHYVCDPKVLAADLGMSLSSIQTVFKSLGCMIAVPTVAECLELELPTQKRGDKLAILRVPLKLPILSKTPRL